MERRGYAYHYERRHYQPRGPDATYGLLAAIVLVFAYELFIQARYGSTAAAQIFAIHRDWLVRPWSLVTSTLSHADLTHLFFNGLFLYFFGPTVERVVGARRFVILFFVTGAVSGVAQVTISNNYALGASGALMALLGVMLILVPKSQMIIFPFPVPIPLWVGGILYAAMDVIGAFNPYSTIGNFAHLAGLALGLIYGVTVRNDLRRKGLRLVTG